MESRRICLDSKIEHHELLLTTISKKPLGQIPENAIVNIKKTIGEPAEIVIRVPKYYLDINDLKTKIHPIYSEVKNERLLILNNDSVFIIKSIELANDEEILARGKSREVRLGEIDIELEDCGLSFYQENKEDEILSLDKYLYEETGWRLGNVSDLVRYEPDSTQEKMRWQESVTKKWYDFIKDDLCEQFECIVEFNSYEKTIDFMKEEELVDDIGLYLSKDQFIRSLQREFDSDKIVTRMKVKGNDEMDIIASTCTGYPYVEDYSYFMEIREMSDDLISALEKYYEIVEKREKIWKEWTDEREKKLTQKKILGSKFIDLHAQITALESVYDVYHRPPQEDEVRAAQILAKITELNDQLIDTKSAIDFLEVEIDNLKKSIDNIVILCQKPTATDDEGNLIFTPALLEELKEYVYTEIYDNDSFLTENVADLINLAKRKLREKSHPTRKWDIDVANFLERLRPDFRERWNGNMALGDLVILYDRNEDTEEFVYFTGYEYGVAINELKLTLSNKKTVKEDGLTIIDYLNKSKNAMRVFEQKKYLLIQQKYNRLNVPKEYIPKYKEKEKERPEGTVID